MSQDRKASYKVPPATVGNSLSSQGVRRSRALEDQKRRRAERIDSTRQLDILADLSLGLSDDDAGEEEDAPDIVQEGISTFATMLPPTAAVSQSTLAVLPTQTLPSLTVSAQLPAPESDMQTVAKKRGKSKRKGKGRASQYKQAYQDTQGTSKGGGKNVKPSKWADKCMYAELLEMKENSDVMGEFADGVPDDIETGWVAVTPVPVGKRCLAVTHQTSGIAGVVPNTTLRSRVLGKALMKPFPSTLPPQTVLDCILDDNWRDNGILHVLDIISWKGQDIADCETPFRFWWRDTRLSELGSFPPPTNANVPPHTAKTQDLSQATAHAEMDPSPKYQFPHPTTFAPVPYHTDTSLLHLLSTLIPLTRTARSIPISIPILTESADDNEGEGAMDLDRDGVAPPLVQLRTVAAEVPSDGLLLYVAQASYEPGTSPLSNWVPLRAYQTREEQESGAGLPESPLDVFERLIRRRIVGGTPEVEMVS